MSYLGVRSLYTLYVLFLFFSFEWIVICHPSGWIVCEAVIINRVNHFLERHIITVLQATRLKNLIYSHFLHHLLDTKHVQPQPKVRSLRVPEAIFPALLVIIFLIFVYITHYQPCQTRTSGYFKRKREYSFEEEFTPKKGQ